MTTETKEAAEYPTVTLQSIQDKIRSKEIVTHVTISGQTLRWAVLTTETGFSVTGDPSCAVCAENDDPVKGEQIAIQNAMDKMWLLEGYLLKHRLSQDKSPEEAPRP